MIQFARQVIKTVEKGKNPLFHYLFVFLFSIMARNFLEVFAYKEVQLSDWYAHLHYSTYYFALVSALILFTAWVTKSSIISTSKLILTFIPIIIICPVVDIGVLYGFNIKQTLGYLSPEIHGPIFSEFFTFFGNHLSDDLSSSKPAFGPSIGYRVEVFSVIVGFGLLLYVKTKNWFKIVGGILGLYAIIYLFCSTPYILKSLLPGKYSPNLVPYYLTLSLIFLISIFWKSQTTLTKAIFRDIRFFRLLFYLFVFVFGAVLGLTKGGVISAPAIFQGIFILISITFAWVYSVITNNIQDVHIDQVSNKSRPLIGKTEISLSNYKKASWVILTISVIFSLYASVNAFYYISIYLLSYFIYSCPPIRFKRVLILSKLPIAINILLLLHLGLSYVGKPEELTMEMLLFILVGGTLALNVIDIKDVKGDAKEGIRTLPVVIGEKQAKFLLAIVFAVGYGFSFLFTENTTLYFVLIGIGLVQFYLITRRKYQDKAVVATFVFSILIVIVEKFL